MSEALGRRLKILVGKPGLDGHSNGAEQIAVRARDVGMDVVYEGIRLTPTQIAASALQEGVHVVGPVDPVGLAPRADPGGHGGAARRAASTRPSWSAGSSPRPTSSRCGGRRRRRLHAQGLRPDADHARHRGAGGGAPRGRRHRREPGSRARRAAARRRPERGARGAQPRREPRDAHRGRSRRCCAASPPPPWAARRPPTSSGSPGRPAPASRRCCARSCAAWRAARAQRRGARGRPLLAALGRRAARRSRADRPSTPPTRGVFIRSTAAAGRLGGLAPATRAAASRPGRRLRRRRHRDRRRGPVRDRGRRGRRHRRGHRPARLRRRPAVPQGGDHGDPRRAGGDQGRPRRRRPARAPRPATRPCARSATATPRSSRCPRSPRSPASTSWWRPSTPTAQRLDLAARRLAARRASALADFVAEHGERGLRALGGRRAAERALAGADPGADVPALVAALEGQAAGA